jgi:serine/arginine repetitive matrix protein 1
MRKLLKENWRNLPEKEQQKQGERRSEGGGQKCENYRRIQEETYQSRSRGKRVLKEGVKNAKITRENMRKLTREEQGRSRSKESRRSRKSRRSKRSRRSRSRKSRRSRRSRSRRSRRSRMRRRSRKSKSRRSMKSRRSKRRRRRSKTKREKGKPGGGGGGGLRRQAPRTGI